MKAGNYERLELVAVRTMLLFVVVGIIAVGCRKKEDVENQNQVSNVQGKFDGDPDNSQPVVELKRFEVDSPFEGEYESPVPKEAKKLWAKSMLWEKAPELIVDKWLADEPETEGKYVLIEFWATWCGPCRKTVPELNNFHKKYGDKLAVIGISDEAEDVVQKFSDDKIDYYVAVDTQARMKKQLNVVGIPHVIIVEPGGSVIWEGFPLLKGYELTEELITNILTAENSEISEKKEDSI